MEVLKVINKKFLEDLKILNDIFVKFNDCGDKFDYNCKYLKRLNEKAEHVLVDEEVKELFFKCRMYFRIRRLNKLICNYSYSSKVESDKASKIFNKKV